MDASQAGQPHGKCCWSSLSDDCSKHLLALKFTNRKQQLTWPLLEVPVQFFSAWFYVQNPSLSFMSASAFLSNRLSAQGWRMNNGGQKTKKINCHMQFIPDLELDYREVCFWDWAKGLMPRQGSYKRNQNQGARRNRQRGSAVKFHIAECIVLFWYHSHSSIYSSQPTLERLSVIICIIFQILYLWICMHII